MKRSSYGAWKVFARASRTHGLRTLLFASLGGMLGLSFTPAIAQEGVVGGSVVEEGSLRPLAGVQVQVEGTRLGTLTNAQGRFLITGVLGPEVTLRVVMLGYRAATQTARVGATDIQIALTQSAIELDRIVVTGTAGGTQRRAIGNVVSQIDAADVVEKAPVSNIQSLLNARAPGVVILPATGMVGSGSRIRIRGSSSLSLSNQPLIYVDGIRVDNAAATGPAVQAFGSSVISRLNDFNPRDIESIEVIKGPAAATLYGTEASNGVIQIITKRGAAGATRYNLSIRQGANWFANAESRVPTNYWRNPNTGQVESLNFAETEAARGAPLWRTGRIQSYNLSMEGGAETIRYYVSGDLEDEEGADWDNQLNRGSGVASLTITPTEKVEVSARLGLVRGRTDLACEAGCGGVTWASYFSTPAHAQADDPRRGARSFPPEYYWNAVDRFQEMSRTTGSVQANHRPAEWFTHRISMGIDEVHEDNQTVVPRSPIYQEWVPSGTGGKDVGRRDVTNSTIDYSASLNFDVTEALRATTSLGTQFFGSETRFVSASGNDFALPGLRVINATADRSGSETFIEQNSVGVFAQQQFGWNNRLFVIAGLRADDHSAFGEDFTMVYYPKVSGTWVLSEEPFFNFPAVNTLRLRAAYGETGKSPGAFDALRTFNAVAGPNDVSAVTPGGIGNPALGPERASEVEFGFDAGFLDDRLGMELTGYNQRTEDFILVRPVAPSTGFPGSRFFNAGEIRNRGMELMVTGTPIRTPAVDWNLSFNIGTNRSKIVDLGGEDRIVFDASFGVEHRVGEPIGGWYHRRIVSAELDANGRHIRESLMCDNGSGGTTPCYDGSRVVAPHVFLGQTQPKAEGGLSSTLMLFDRLQLYGLLDFKSGYRKWDHVTRVRCSLFNVCLENADPLATTTDPALLAAYQTGATFGAAYINDASYWKLRELSAGYTVPRQWANRIGSDRVMLNIAARNLYTWTNWTGMDPEAMFLGGGRGGFTQLEQNHLPQVAQFITSLHLTF
jgi:TonB-linked SusC/RagA family outer membrane protein